MQKIILVFTAVLLVTVAACKKSSDPAPPANTGVEFKFVSLSASDSTLKVNGVLNITATATGSNLKYKWSATYGTFIGSGQNVQYTVCHADKFCITCQISDDQGHSDSKDIYVRAY